MKKILIVNNNLDTGGIQKSLINLLKAIHEDYEITLLLFSKTGILLNEVPKNVKIISPNKGYRILGLSKAELKKYPLQFMLKFILLRFSLFFSRRRAMRLLGVFQGKLKGYDVVISYSHLFNHKYFANGSGDFVLDKTVCKNKICFVHCDYLNSGCMSELNNCEYAEFDKIACCSDSVRTRFITGSGLPENKVYTLRNFADLDIYKLAEFQPYEYDDKYINLITVARLSPEKGIDRAIEILRIVNRSDIRYYIIGNGPMKDKLLELVKRYKLESQVFFLGEQKNPYQYMKNADYLLVPSLHEAAPIVFDEAKALGLRIISSNTTSAKEMISDFGVVCENEEEMKKCIFELDKKTKVLNYYISNEKKKKCFSELIG